MSTQQDINAFRAQRLANTHDPLALMANTQTPFHPDQSSHITYIQHPQPNNNFVQQPSFNTNYMQQPIQNLEDNSDPTTTMNKALALLAKAFKLNTPVRQNVVQYAGNEAGQNAYGNGNVVTTPDEGNGNGNNGNLIRCYNCRGEGHYASNCTVKSRKRDAAYLQQQLHIAQEEEVGIESTQEEFEFMIVADAHESDNTLVYDSDGSTEVSKDDNCYDHDIFNMLNHEVQYTDLQIELDHTKEKLENCIIKKEKEYVVLNYAKENVHLKTTYKNLFDSIKVIQAQTHSIIDSLQKQLYDTIYENAKLRAQLFDKVSDQRGTTKGTRTNTMFTKQSILGKTPSSSSKPKLYSVTPFPKSSVLPKVDKTNALTRPSKASRVDNVVPNKLVKTSVRTKSITVSHPNVIHKQQANSDSNGFSSTKVNNTAKTRRPHLRSNSNTDKVPSKSKSSCLLNNVEKIEENQKYMSSECNNITLAIRNAKSKIVCVMCKQCLVIVNHDVCVLNYVNDMNSHADNQSVNVSKCENQKKHKANVKKSKELGSKGSLASSRPSKPRTCLSTSNPSKPSSKGFSNSTSLLGRLSRLRKQLTSIYPIAVL
ncbi:reverse transcriptase domain-containing protein [Tanacetum coccineum]